MNSKFDEALILINKRKFIEAKTIFYEILKNDPNNFAAYNNIGNICFILGNLDDALENYGKAIKFNPDFADAYNNKGNVLRKLNKINDAITNYQKAVKIDQYHSLAFYNLAEIFKEQKNNIAAIENYQKAINLKPDYIDSYIGLGNLYLGLNNNRLALENYQKAINLKPDFDFLYGTIIHIKLKMCSWDNLDIDLKILENKVLELKKISLPFPLLTFNNSLELQKISSETWARHEMSNQKNRIEPILKKNFNKKIRIGYYSADFHEHPMSYLIVNLLELHDRSKFEIFGFYFGPNRKDEIYTNRVFKAFDKFIDVSLKSETEIANISRELHIDIAIDLMGYTKKNRFKIFVEKCAPIQVNYLGYAGTLGSNCIDYIIADKILIPKESQKFYSEKVIYLPNTYQPTDSKKKISEKSLTKDQFNLPQESFIFCCFNQNSKILPKTFDIWMRILKGVKDSVLWLVKDNEISCKNLKKEASKRGIESNRIIFTERSMLPEYLAKFKLADLFIDTYPYTAHTTCSDALWAGLPILTLEGETFASRVSSSLLNASGLLELITKNSNEYEEKAIEFGNNPSKIESLKKKIENSKFTEPLFNTKLFAEHIEKAYLEIQKKYNENKKPENIEIK